VPAGVHAGYNPAWSTTRGSPVGGRRKSVNDDSTVTVAAHSAEAAPHPRPLLARDNWLDLGGEWGFAYDDDEVGLHEGWQRREDVFDRCICVPYPPESPASGIGDTGYHPVVWYRRLFSLCEADSGERIILHCGAIDYRATIWVNGAHVTDHEGGQTPIEADITPMLHPDGEQVIVIRAEDRPEDLAQPRGKQDWRERPHGIWYERTTGIWQPVWLETVARVYIADVRWTPDLNRAVLGLSVTLGREAADPVYVRVHLELNGLPLAEDSYRVTGSVLDRELALDLGSMTMSRDSILWTPENPNLLDATLTVFDGDRPIDEVHSYVGLRSVDVAGGRFMLNGRPYYLRLVLEQGYWPETNLAAPSDEMLRREVELAKSLGFNGIRIHQKVEDPRFLYWCDRIGLMVWGEMANAYVYSRASVERLTREWIEVLDRNYSHPCIVAWVPLNESWGVPNLLNDPAQQDFVRAIYHLTKSIDPTRPVIANDGWEYLCGDVFGIHDYTFHGDVIRQRYGSTEAIARTLREVQPAYRFVTLGERERPGTPVMLTEFGGISYEPDPDVPWYGYGTVAGRDAFLEKYHELVNAVLDCQTVAGFCYTQLTDTGQETNGLLTAAREPKLDPAAIRAINSRPSAAVAGDIVHQLRRTSGTSFGGEGPLIESP